MKASGLDFDSIFNGLEGILGRFWVSFGRDFIGLWVILDFSELFCVIEAFWGYLGRVLAGAACLFACFCWLAYLLLGGGGACKKNHQLH